MKEHFGVSDSKMGLFFTFSGLTYLFGCAFIPSFFENTPPRLLITGNFVFTIIGLAFMGPSKVLHLPDSMWLIGLGIGMTTFGTSAAFSLVISELQKRCTVNYQIVEGSDLEMEGKLSD